MHSSLTDPFQFVYEALMLVTIGVWVAYCAMPEPLRKPVVVPANSTIYRWNEIASALGHRHPGRRGAARSSFFLTDVEKVVDKVLTRNLRESRNQILIELLRGRWEDGPDSA